MSVNGTSSALVSGFIVVDRSVEDTASISRCASEGQVLYINKSSFHWRVRVYTQRGAATGLFIDNTSCLQIETQHMQSQWAVAVACLSCSQPAGIGLLPAWVTKKLKPDKFFMGKPSQNYGQLRSPQQKSRPTCTQFRENVIIVVTTTLIDMKPNTCPANGRHASVCQISPSYDAAFIGHRQNKQTLKYLEDY